MCMESSLTFQLVVQWSLFQREGVLGKVTLRNFLWEKYDYVKEESYAPSP